LITPGPNEPSGFIMTTILGIVGAIVASYLGQALGWYSAGEGVWCYGRGSHCASCLGCHCFQADPRSLKLLVRSGAFSPEDHKHLPVVGDAAAASPRLAQAAC
jgi:Transglycosylase associated protein